MPFRTWDKELPGGFLIRIERTTRGATFVDFAVVLIYGGECIGRYDTAHGFAHQDVLGRRSGLIQKKTDPTLSNREVFQHAIKDFSENFERYLAFYESH